MKLGDGVIGGAALDVFAEAPAPGGRRVHGEVMVASLVTLYKKLKFVPDENVGWGPIDLPELELQTTAAWLVVSSWFSAAPSVSSCSSSAPTWRIC